MNRRAVSLALAGIFGVAVAVAHAAPPRTEPVDGLRTAKPDVHALVGARLVVSPDQTIERGTIVVRDGVIAEIGATAGVPPDARVWDLTGQTVYAGFVDLGGELPADAASNTLRTGPGYWNDQVTPEFRASAAWRVDREQNEKLRRQGITSRLVAPQGRVIHGSSALVTTADVAEPLALLKPEVALHLQLTTKRIAYPKHYPGSPMGVVALVRQAFYDARWYDDAWRVFDANRALPRPEQNVSLSTLRASFQPAAVVMIDAPDVQFALRADRLAREFGLNIWLRGSGAEYQRLEAIKATGRPILVPVNFPRTPDVRSPERADGVALHEMMHWDLAPENPARLAAAGVKIVLSTHRLKDPTSFVARVRQAVAHGLAPADAIRALTITPAQLVGMDDRLGTLGVGKLAQFVVCNGDLFTEKTKLVETWVDGHRYPARPERLDVRGLWQWQVDKLDGGSETLQVTITGEIDKPTGRIERSGKSTKLSHVAVDGQQWLVTFAGKELGWDGVQRASLTVEQTRTDRPTGDEASATSAVRKPRALGTLVDAAGRRLPVSAERLAPHSPPADESNDKPGDESAANKPTDPPQEKPITAADKPASPPAKPPAKRPTRALYEVNYPLGEFGRAAAPEQPKTLLVRGATLWTADGQGTLTDTDLLVESGRIKQIGRGLAVPDGATVVEAHGKHVTPGIIDCHSHIATDGGINEPTQSITSEVRIGDFIDALDVNLYRQLAGGVTTANILHGSSNTIGGQNQVIKFRWGAPPEGLKFVDAPGGIKFALGENVKQSNWPGGPKNRYPQSRMGVEQLLRDAFRAAQEYRLQQRQYRDTKQGLPPRHDLELEALAEVLEGTRLVHCHAYRQDEILALLRACEPFRVRIATFQHVLEGYKVADLIAQAGAGASSFSDWWAFKFEVFDAIPYNGALLHQAGVVTSFNSDDAELARRLNLEAAKAVKYGGVAPDEALKFVTFNPARQLGIDRRVGSLTVGKDADFVVWSGPPLSSFSRCEQTWIDGCKYFDRTVDAQLRAELTSRRTALIQRMLASGETPDDSADKKTDDWPRADIYCHTHDGREMQP